MYVSSFNVLSSNASLDQVESELHSNTLISSEIQENPEDDQNDSINSNEAISEASHSDDN